MKFTGLKLLFLAAAPSFVVGEDEPVEYGVDVSFPMQYAEVSTNYPWLEHNMDPSKPVPKEYEGMVLQPLGNRQEVYSDYIQGCFDKWPNKKSRCEQNELDRIAMTLRQPQSMQNYVSCIVTCILGRRMKNKLPRPLLSFGAHMQSL